MTIDATQLPSVTMIVRVVLIVVATCAALAACTKKLTRDEELVAEYRRDEQAAAAACRRGDAAQCVTASHGTWTFTDAERIAFVLRGCELGDANGCYIASMRVADRSASSVEPERFAQRSCALGSAEGCAQIGRVLEDRAPFGSVGDVDRARAVVQFRDACEKGYGYACHEAATRVHVDGWNDDVERLLARQCELATALSIDPCRELEVVRSLPRERATAAAFHIQECRRPGGFSHCQVLAWSFADDTDAVETVRATYEEMRDECLSARPNIIECGRAADAYRDGSHFLAADAKLAARLAEVACKHDYTRWCWK